MVALPPSTAQSLSPRAYWPAPYGVTAGYPQFFNVAERSAEAERGASSASLWGRLKDPEDGRLDITANRPDASGLLPFVVPFNEPAVGAGLVLGLAYFHPGNEPLPESVDVAQGPEETTGYLTLRSAW